MEHQLLHERSESDQQLLRALFTWGSHVEVSKSVENINKTT